MAAASTVGRVADYNEDGSGEAAALETWGEPVLGLHRLTVIAEGEAKQAAAWACQGMDWKVPALKAAEKQVKSIAEYIVKLRVALSEQGLSCKQAPKKQRRKQGQKLIVIKQPHNIGRPAGLFFQCTRCWRTSKGRWGPRWRMPREALEQVGAARCQASGSAARLGTEAS